MAIENRKTNLAEDDDSRESLVIKIMPFNLRFAASLQTRREKRKMGIGMGRRTWLGNETMRPLLLCCLLFTVSWPAAERGSDCDCAGSLKSCSKGLEFVGSFMFGVKMDWIYLKRGVGEKWLVGDVRAGVESLPAWVLGIVPSKLVWAKGRRREGQSMNS